MDLVEEQKLSINEISLAKVAEQYIAYLKSLADMPKEELAAFLVVASTLMLIKSRSLIPGVSLSEEEESDIKELEKRLRTFKFFKELSAHLRELDKKGMHLFGREAYVGMRAVFFPPEGLDSARLKAVLDEILQAIPQKESLQENVLVNTVSIETKMLELKERLEKFMSLTFDETRKQSKGKTDVIVSFLAMLELIKQGFMIFEQRQLFGTINLKRTEEKT